MCLEGRRVTTLGYVVYDGETPLVVYVDKEQAKWCAFMLGRNAKIKRFTARVLLGLLRGRRK